MRIMSGYVSIGIVLQMDGNSYCHGCIGLAASLHGLRMVEQKTETAITLPQKTAPPLMIETGLYGGSFNPIHKGHIRLAEYLCQSGEVSELWFLVSPQNPFKSSSQELLPEEQRLELTRLAITGHPKLQACDFEFRLPRPSFMVHTLEALRRAYPDRKFSLVIGADNWVAFNRWKDPEEILRHHRILVYPRTGYTVDPQSLPYNAKLVNTPLIDISSTELRQCIARGEDASYGLEPAVWQKIKEEGYYR